jgi:hypothetical protein
MQNEKTHISNHINKAVIKMGIRSVNNGFMTKEEFFEVLKEVQRFKEYERLGVIDHDTIN